MSEPLPHDDRETFDCACGRVNVKRPLHSPSTNMCMRCYGEPRYVLIRDARGYQRSTSAFRHALWAGT